MSRRSLRSIAMMNEMVILFKIRQSEDDRKMPYCITSFDETANPISTLREETKLTEKFDRHVKGESEVGMN